MGTGGPNDLGLPVEAMEAAISKAKGQEEEALQKLLEEMRKNEEG